MDATCQNMSCLLLQLKSRQEKDVISGGPKKEFLPQPNTSHTTIKAPPNNKTQKYYAFYLRPISFPHKVHKIKIEKQVSISY